jgi:hypothetical protein
MSHYRDHPSQTSYSRRASNAVEHRRPAWAKNEISHKATLNPRRETPSPFNNKPDMIDNFSYDPDHLQHWELPAGIADDLSEDILEKTRDWQKAGAAVITALDRIHQTYKDAMYEAYPDKSGSPTYRRPSSHASAVVGVAFGSLTWSPPDSPISLAPIRCEQLAFLEDKNPLMKGFTQAGLTQQMAVMGMESPPATPVDSPQGTGTPRKVSNLTENVGGGNASNKPTVAKINTNTGSYGLPDLVRLHSQLSPLSSPLEPLTPVLNPEFDQNSWERFLGQYQEEMRDNKECMSRFKGYGRQIKILTIEAKTVTELKTKIALYNFGKWYDGLQGNVREYEGKVKALEMPKKEFVEMEWDSVRSHQMGQPLAGVMESEDQSFGGGLPY